MMINYDNKEVRRRDRLLSESDALRVLKESDYGVLSMITDDGEAYGIPLNYVWDEKSDSLYLHCAPEGRKLRSVRKNPEVSFCVTGRTHILPERFTANYESVVLKCDAEVDLSDEERRRAMRVFLQKYAPGMEEKGMKYAELSLHRTEIIRLRIIQMSGKCKNIEI